MYYKNLIIKILDKADMEQLRCIYLFVKTFVGSEEKKEEVK